MRIPPPNSLISAQFTQNIAELRQSIAQTAEEATTGRYSDLTAHLSGRIGSAMLSQKAVDDIAFQRELLSQREVRLDITQNNLSLINERSTGVGVSMRIALGSGDLVSQGLAARDAKAAHLSGRILRQSRPSSDTYFPVHAGCARHWRQQ